jgi:acyl-lipid omega-6 desaturase (Delta-12 desaturase)
MVSSIIMATKEFAKEDRSKSWRLTITTLLLLLLAFAGSRWNFHWSAKIICSLLISLLSVRMFMIYHDHQHRAILNRSKIAEVIMTIYGLYILAPTSIWKRSHDHHHKNNSKLFSASIGSYPIMTKEKYLNASKSERFAYLATRHPVTILLGYLTMFVYGMCLRSFMNNPKKHFDSLIALIIHFSVAFLLFWFGGWPALSPALLLKIIRIGILNMRHLNLPVL